MEPPPQRPPVARGTLGELYVQIRDAVVIMDEQWRLLRLNPAGERLLGYTEDELGGRSGALLFADPAELAAARPRLEERLAPAPGGPAEAAQLRLRSRAGRVFTAQCKLIRMEGSLALLVQEEASADSSQADRALIRQVNQLAETALRVVGQTDVRPVAQAFTDLAKEMLEADFTGVALGEPGGPDGFQITLFTYNAPRHLFPERFPRAVGLLGSALRTRSTIRLPDIRGHPQGVGIPVQHPPVGALLAIPLIDGERLVGELLAANRPERGPFTAVSESIARHLGMLLVAALANARLQQELAAERNRMAGLERAKTRFLNLASHELRGPIAILHGYLSMIEEGLFPGGPPPEVTSTLVAKIREMDFLVSQMLDAARLEDSQLELKAEPVDLTQVAEETVRRVRSSAGLKHDLRLEGRAGAGLVMGDRTRLGTILGNLLDNAVKYSPDGGLIVCSVGVNDDRVQVSVKDQGLGISAEDLPRLFSRFGRLVTPANSHIPGTGLGLYLARELARLQGGDIEVASTAGRGSTFTLWLPRLA